MEPIFRVGDISIGGRTGIRKKGQSVCGILPGERYRVEGIVGELFG